MWFKRRPAKPVEPAHADPPENVEERRRNLDMRPARNRLVREERTEQGFARLIYLSAYKPWFAGVARRLGMWDGKPLERKLELDELGTFCWELIDGRNSVRDVAARLAGHYGLPGREAELAVAGFLRELGRRGIVGLRD
ncbi:PqqD family protein [Fundidesulfovibrio agrisoli]|uniref:PqqD family protein n=1 Tax=Fundidesulfovibrio agrisoli TaxID=2922717 RepID=UPI001FAC0F06|nr:PqqD family protein [Fundidesulfovibrio agrisoli]